MKNNYTVEELARCLVNIDQSLTGLAKGLELMTMGLTALVENQATLNKKINLAINLQDNISSQTYQ